MLLVTVPVGFYFNARVADELSPVSVVAVVAIFVVTSVGVVTVTVNGSHGLVAGLLLVSPLYVAFQLKEPSEVKVTGVESGTLLLTTLTVNVKAAGPTLQVLVPFHT